MRMASPTWSSPLFNDPIGFVNTAADELAAVPPAELLANWRATRSQLPDALLTVDEGRKLPWFGPPMNGASMAAARLMETWAHGLDVADALGVTRPATARLRSIAHIGVHTRDFAFVINELPPPVNRSGSSFVHLMAASGRGDQGCHTAGHRVGQGFLLSGHSATPAA